MPKELHWSARDIVLSVNVIGSLTSESFADNAVFAVALYKVGNKQVPEFPIDVQLVTPNMCKLLQDSPRSGFVLPRLAHWASVLHHES